MPSIIEMEMLLRSENPWSTVQYSTGQQCVTCESIMACNHPEIKFV